MIYNNVLELIGKTPVLKLNNFNSFPFVIFDIVELIIIDLRK